MHEPFSAKDWMQLALGINIDGSTDLDDVLSTLRRAARADLAFVVRNGVVVTRFGVPTDASIDEVLVEKAINVDKRFELEAGGSCEIARRELTESDGILVAGREDDFSIEDHEAISTVAHLLDLALAPIRPVVAPATAPAAPAAAPVVATPGSLNDAFAGADVLTGLLTKDEFRKRIIDDATDTIGASSVIVLDLDGFTVANDTLGFATGDIVLQTVASRILIGIRENDIAARIGGDEFAVYCPGIGFDLAREVAERLQASISSVIPIGESDLVVTASVGVASAPTNPVADELIGNADTAMRTAKLRGRGSLDVYDAGLAEAVRYRRSLTSELQEAIVDNQLTTVLEPIVAVPSLELVGREALVRWQHPARGLLDPAEFVDLAEQIGRVADIERAVISFALQHQQSGQDKPPTSINLSATSFLDRRQLDWMIEQMHAMHVHGSQLIIEIRECVVDTDPDTARDHLELLQRNGIGTALDRFGDGPTSITTLHRFPFDGVKLDPALLAGPNAETLLRAIYASAELCGFDVIHPRLGTDHELDHIGELEAHIGHDTFYVQGRAVEARMADRSAVVG